MNRQVEIALKALEGKTGKAAQRQTEKLKRYLEENDIELTKPIAIKTKVKHYITTYYKDVKSPKTPFNKDGTLATSKKPLIHIILFDDINKHTFFDKLKEAENLESQCLIYDFKYLADKHRLMLQCQSCYYAYTVNNKFCELMVKAIWDSELGFEKVYNKYWEDSPSYRREIKEIKGMVEL